MGINTRFNPTVNGPLHLGHLYLVLVNEYEAHSTGGIFTVRFDDSKPCTLTWASDNMEKVARCRRQQLADIEQFVTVDYSWSEYENKWRLTQMPPILIRDWRFMDSPELCVFMASCPHQDQVTGAGGDMYPYVPGWTAEKVFMDMMTGVNWLIRGDDLVSEFALYQFFNEVLGSPMAKHTYMPRLHPPSGYIDTISKTRGGFSVAEMVAKHGVNGVLDILRDACLVDGDGPFSVVNIKAEPRLTL